VDVLCLDKTGTLTERGIVFDAAHQLAQTPEPGWEQALGWFAAEPEANATAECLAAAFDDDGGNGDTLTWVLGAPDVMLAEHDGGAWTTTGTGAASVDVLTRAGTLAAAGLRTLLLAYADGGPPSSDQAELRPVAVLSFRERIRPDAKQTLNYFRQEGVELKTHIRGRSAHRRSNCSTRGPGRQPGIRRPGLAAGSRPAGTSHGNQRGVWPCEPFPENGCSHSTPEAYRRHDRRRRQRCAGVEGRGPWAREDSAAAATKAVARLVLLDGRFDRLLGVVAEGRRVIANIGRVSSLFLSKTAYSIAIAASLGLLRRQVSFLPRQLSFTDGLTIGIPLRVRLERYRGLIASPFNRVGREPGIQSSCPVQF
jgi:cation-transporting ATPase E